jgi:hypothetical protein
MNDCQRALGGKGFPRVRDLIGEALSKSNETVISRSIWAKLIKGKGRSRCVTAIVRVASRRRSVERRQKDGRLVVGPSAEAMATQSNQTNPRSDLRNGFRALPVRPTVTVAPGQQRSCPCYSRESLEIESSTALQDGRTRGSGMSAVARQGRASSVAATVR